MINFLASACYYRSIRQAVWKRHTDTIIKSFCRRRRLFYRPLRVTEWWQLLPCHVTWRLFSRLIPVFNMTASHANVLASVDLGSNSFRLQICENHNGQLKVIDSFNKVHDFFMTVSTSHVEVREFFWNFYFGSVWDLLTWQLYMRETRMR